MKLKTYFAPKVVRVLAILLLVLALGYAAVTAFDVLQTPSATGEKPEKVLKPDELKKAQEELLEKTLPPEMRRTPTVPAPQAQEQKQKQEAPQAAVAPKVEEDRSPAAMEKMGEKISGIIGDCRSQNKEWFVCKADKECAEIIGVCGARDAANREFRSDVENCNRLAGASMNCQPFARARTVPRCVKGVCVAQKQETKPAPKTP